ncbi:hypothetical protein WOLCODRAFT_158453 [Wolfiporia cocos MD-104 SS10]|uniref:Uncharacterized protein n=1 Tax=Wolfiporia cocos (strain MD-104) TaxID=742152 RepID=A0A2H3JSB3_WOLCO|nr:hypothetical protein WOLCODRAFT_158453 [Wolfiporia cocos MD-104 SS10]
MALQDMDPQSQISCTREQNQPSTVQHAREKIVHFKGAAEARGSIITIIFARLLFASRLRCPAAGDEGLAMVQQSEKRRVSTSENDKATEKRRLKKGDSGEQDGDERG